MRLRLSIIATPLLVFVNCCFAQGINISPTPIPPAAETPATPLRLAPAPAPNPERMILNPSKASIKLMLEVGKPPAAAQPDKSRQSAPNPVSPPNVMAAGAVSLTQPGMLPTPAQVSTPLSVEQPPMQGTMAPPPPVFRTMKEASEAKVSNIATAIGKTAPVPEAPVASPLQRLLAAVVTYQKYLIGGAAGLLLLAMLLARVLRKRQNDADE